MSSVFLITLVIALFQQIAFCAIDFDSFDFKLYLNTENTYLIAWSVEPTKTNITIAVSAPTTGWAAFGLSPTGSMPLSDIALFWVDDTKGTVFLQDRYTSVNREMPLLDTNQNLILIEGEQVDGKTNIVFQRAVNPCDTDSNSQDYPIVSGTSRAIIAYSDDNSDPVFTSYNSEDISLSEITFSYHGQNRASQSVNLLDGTDLVVELESNIETFDVVVNNYHMPSATTTYHEDLFTLPVSGNEKYHIVKIEPIVTQGNELHVHHFVLYYCNAGNGCTSAAYAWAIGSQGLTFPENVGLEMSSEYLHTVKLQIHYDNPQQVSDVYDSSGLRLYYTSTLRQHTAGLMEFGLPLGEWQFIPPGIDDALNTAYCMSGCTNAKDALPTEGVYAFNAFLHAHTLGVALELKHIRNGIELAPIAQNMAYDFDYQQSQPLSEHRQFLPGDEFQLDCFYDSSSQTEIMYGGDSTDEEMCQAYIYVYPRPKLAKCVSSFTEGQIGGFWNIAEVAGYATGVGTNDVTYNLGGDPYTYSLSGSPVTWQNGEELYKYLWTETGVNELKTRYQLCLDHAGNNLTGVYNLEIPNGYTPYVSNTQCKDINNPVGQVGEYSIPNTITTTNEIASTKICGSVTSDGTSTEISVNVCINSDIVEIILTGPDSVWFGIGFGAINMANAYAIVVSGDNMNEIGEYILTQWSAGTTAPFDGTNGIILDSRTNEDGIVSVVLKRDRKSSESGVYSFPNVATKDINVIFGKGTGKIYEGPMGGHSNNFVVLELETEDIGDGDDGNMISIGLLMIFVNIIISFVF